MVVVHAPYAVVRFTTERYLSVLSIVQSGGESECRSLRIWYSPKIDIIHIALGFLSLIIAVTSYSLYFRDIFRYRTKPHGFTWFIWTALNLLVFYQQLSNGGGPGAWVTAAAAIANGFIFLSSFKYGTRNVSRFDWLCLGLACIAVSAWILNVGSEISVILASIAFVIGFIPTFRKSLTRPTEETAITFGLNGIKFLIALFALESFTLTTALYPLILCIVNGFFAVYLFAHQPSRAHKKQRT